MVATAVDHEHSVTPRELFFDLVFVFAFTQVTTLLAHDPTFTGIGRGVSWTDLTRRPSRPTTSMHTS